MRSGSNTFLRDNATFISSHTRQCADRYEVSNEEYLEFATSTSYKSDSEVYGWSFVFDKAGTDHNSHFHASQSEYSQLSFK